MLQHRPPRPLPTFLHWRQRALLIAVALACWSPTVAFAADAKEAAEDPPRPYDGGALSGECAELPQVRNAVLLGADAEAPPWFQPCLNKNCVRTCHAMVVYQGQCAGFNSGLLTGSPEFPLCMPAECSSEDDLGTLAKSMQAHWKATVKDLEMCEGATSRFVAVPSFTITVDCAPWGGSVEVDSDGTVVSREPRQNPPTCESTEASLSQFFRGDSTGAASGEGSWGLHIDGSVVFFGVVVVLALLASGYALGYTKQRQATPAAEGFIPPSFQEAHYTTSVSSDWAPSRTEKVDFEASTTVPPSPFARSDWDGYGQHSHRFRPEGLECHQELMAAPQSGLPRLAQQARRAYLDTDPQAPGWWPSPLPEDRGTAQRSNSSSSQRGYRDYFDRCNQEQRDLARLSTPSLNTLGPSVRQDRRHHSSFASSRSNASVGSGSYGGGRGDRSLGRGPSGGLSVGGMGSLMAQLQPQGSRASESFSVSESGWPQSEARVPPGSIEV